jgi:hypothetical protein
MKEQKINHFKREKRKKKIVEEIHFILTPCAQPNPCLISDVSN